MWGWGFKTYYCVILGLVHSLLCHIIAYVCIGKYIICIYICINVYIYIHRTLYIYILIYQNILNSIEVLLQDWPRKIARKKVQESRVEALPNRVPMGVQCTTWQNYQHGFWSSGTPTSYGVSYGRLGSCAADTRVGHACAGPPKCFLLVHKAH